MKTDNSHIDEKVKLRILAIRNIKNPKVLECFAGEGILWDIVKKRTGKNIDILRIEKENKKGDKIYLPGDNLKYLKTIDLQKYDIIDLDNYGIPYNQLELIFSKQYSGIIVVTFITSIFGKIPNKLLNKLGYTNKMIKKIPTIFNKNGIEKLKNYLYLSGVKEIKGYFLDNKSYFIFQIKNH